MIKSKNNHYNVRNAGPSDSGNYTCKPSIFKTAAVRLHVLTGENHLCNNKDKAYRKGTQRQKTKTKAKVKTKIKFVPCDLVALL